VPHILYILHDSMRRFSLYNDGNNRGSVFGTCNFRIWWPKNVASHSIHQQLFGSFASSQRAFSRALVYGRKALRFLLLLSLFAFWFLRSSHIRKVFLWVLVSLCVGLRRIPSFPTIFEHPKIKIKPLKQHNTDNNNRFNSKIRNLFYSARATNIPRH